MFEVLTAWFYLLNSYWLLVWAVQNLRLQKALSCNSIDTQKYQYRQSSEAVWKHTKIQIVLWTYRLKCAQTFLWKYTELNAAHSGTLLVQSQWPVLFYCSSTSHFTKRSSRSRKVLTKFQQIFIYSWSFHNILFCLARCSAVSGNHMAYQWKFIFISWAFATISCL